MFIFKVYTFHVKCNDTPPMIIKVVAENCNKAVSYAKKYVYRRQFNLCR